MERINNRYIRDMKTAVEWFALELYEKFEMKGDGNLFDDLLEQAKAMFEEQIESAYRKGYTESSWGRHSNSENYYNETFKSE